jgi:hypothetical protein
LEAFGSEVDRRLVTLAGLLMIPLTTDEAAEPSVATRKTCTTWKAK